MFDQDSYLERTTSIENYLTDNCAFDANEFTSEDEIKEYFTEENFIHMFGKDYSGPMFSFEDLIDAAIGMWEQERLGK